MLSLVAVAFWQTIVAWIRFVPICELSLTPRPAALSYRDGVSHSFPVCQVELVLKEVATVDQAVAKAEQSLPSLAEEAWFDFIFSEKCCQKVNKDQTLKWRFKFSWSPVSHLSHQHQWLRVELCRHFREDRSSMSDAELVSKSSSCRSLVEVTSTSLREKKQIEVQKYNSTVTTILASYHLTGCVSNTCIYSSMIVLSSLILSYDWILVYYMSYVNALLNFLKSAMIILFLFPTGCQKGGDSGPEQGRCVARGLCRERPGRCQGLPYFHTFSGGSFLVWCDWCDRDQKLGCYMYTTPSVP